jgi:hypothetical protein
MEKLTVYRKLYCNCKDDNSYETTHIKVKTVCHEGTVKEN